jgi:uncharacterized protein
MIVISIILWRCYKVIEILARWNRWGGAKLSAGFKREITQKLYPFLDSNEVVALIGARRAGKTTVLYQVMDILEKEGIKQEAMLHMNFEEPALSPMLNLELLDQLYDTYREEIYPKGKAYLFLDEIQNIPKWERWVRARNETEDIKIFVTGSSSKLMSRELATVLTGRHVSFHVFPLNFREFLQFNSIPLPKSITKASYSPVIQNALNSYMKWGGFPEIVLAEDEQRKELLLKQYFDDVLFKDVAMRHHIRDTFTLRNIAVHLLTQTGSLISYRRIAKIFEVSLDLARSYCHYLQEAFVVDFVSFYSRKAAERMRNPSKVYAVDLGLRRIVSLTQSEDDGHVVETASYHALQQQTNDGIFYWKQKNEIDFVIRKANSITNLIQVVFEGMDRPEVQERELQALEEAGTVFPKAEQLIIMGKGPKMLHMPNKIKIFPLWYYLLSQ